MALTRAYVAGRIALELDGKPCGLLKSVSGGGISAEVIDEPATEGPYMSKHIGQPTYEDISLAVNYPMPQAVHDWVAASWTTKYQRKSGSIIACNFDMQAMSKREFIDALVVETIVPALDGSSKDPGFMTVKLRPELIRNAKASGKVDGGLPTKASQQKFVLSNFRLTIDGLEKESGRVSKIDSFAVKQTVASDDIGDARDYLKEPARLEIPNLKITFPAAFADKFYEWFDDFVIKGNNGADKEKNGKLEFLSPNAKEVLGGIKLERLGIFRISEDASSANSDKIHTVSAELYCEKMELLPSKGAA